MDQRHWLSEYLVSSDSKILFEKKNQIIRLIKIEPGKNDKYVKCMTM